MRIIACQDLIRSQTTGVEEINNQATSKRVFDSTCVTARTANFTTVHHAEISCQGYQCHTAGQAVRCCLAVTQLRHETNLQILRFL